MKDVFSQFSILTSLSIRRRFAYLFRKWLRLYLFVVVIFSIIVGILLLFVVGGPSFREPSFFFCRLLITCTNAWAKSVSMDNSFSSNIGISSSPSLYWSFSGMINRERASVFWFTRPGRYIIRYSSSISLRSHLIWRPVGLFNVTIHFNAMWSVRTLK